ncbi:hypothetical protein K9S39_39235 [Streptomyces halobius]|uniref:Uncharacterized protein n=1 Tax=Streptomyces halobius TaxID=2879846 RepID=A0ABY4MH22_9ACTN|nr:hypothetical protein K9S39_39235 [Streptomyces halobius]
MGKIARVFDDHPDGLGINRIAEAAGLTVPQVERALAWQSERFAAWCRRH